MLVLRSTKATRDLANAFEETLRAAYPARATEAVAALRSASVPWPGPALIWAEVDGRGARILDGPPRPIRLGR